ncbi:hypothetical protein EV426DRAFT_613650 [Tirmania nivea]|nr:hypothetical protein EV426DRAFT_613650 [Tirmania nivea]
MLGPDYSAYRNLLPQAVIPLAGARVKAAQDLSAPGRQAAADFWRSRCSTKQRVGHPVVSQPAASSAAIPSSHRLSLGLQCKGNNNHSRRHRKAPASCRMSGDHSPNEFAPARNYTEAQNAQRSAAIEDVRRIMAEEVRTDWIDLWEERWRKRLEKLQSRAVNRGKGRDGPAGVGSKPEKEGEGGDSEDGGDGDENDDDDDDGDDDGDEDDDQGEWDGAGTGWDADRKDGEEVWVHRGEDSDFLKATDTFPSPGPLPWSPIPPQRNNVAGSPGQGGAGEGWTASVTRLMGGMGFGSSSPQLQPQSQSQPQPQLQPTRSNAAPSSSTSPSFTAGTTPATLSANPSDPGSPPQSLAAAASPYRFASPDSITPSLAALRQKKREELGKQMDLSGPEGNVGLKCWVERRDAWTGANEEGCVRVGRSKFAENLLTTSVNEAAYSAIYNKCIKKALPPAVPINLRHITNAMVAGWKKDNEWPPAIAPPEPSFSKKRAVRALGRGTGSPATGGSAGPRRVLGML